MSSITVKIPFLYTLTYMPLRGVKPRIAAIQDEVEVSLPSASAADAPIVVEAGDLYYRHDRRSFAGELYGPASDITQTTGAGPTPPGAGGVLQTCLINTDNVMRTMFPLGAPEALDVDYRRFVEPRPMAIARVVVDNREAAIEALTHRARDLLVVDDMLFRKALPPMHALVQRKDSSWEWTLVDPSSNDFVGFRLGLDRHMEMEAIMARVMRGGGPRVDTTGIEVERMDADASMIVEAGPNAEAAARMVLSALGKAMADLPFGILEKAAILSRVVQTKPDGAYVDVQSVHAALVAIRDSIPEKQFSQAKRLIGIGLDFIETSREFHAGLLDEADMDALQGIAP